MTFEKKEYENKIIIILLSILVLVLLEGFLCRPYIGPSHHIECHLTDPPLLCKFAFCKNYFFNNFWLENGLVENFQTLFLIISIYFLLKAKNFFFENKKIKYFLILKIIALIYYLGEEISWGQHFLNWSSPSWFLKNNNQAETNIHNVINLFDQLPRTLVLLWCSVVPIIAFISIKLSSTKNDLIMILMPNKKLIIFAILVLFFVLPDLIVDKFEIINNDISYDQRIGYFYDMITFNFLRLSELHELLFCYYFLFYSYSFTKLKRNNIYKSNINDLENQ